MYLIIDCISSLIYLQQKQSCICCHFYQRCDTCILILTIIYIILFYVFIYYISKKISLSHFFPNLSSPLCCKIHFTTYKYHFSSFFFNWKLLYCFVSSFTKMPLLDTLCIPNTAVCTRLLHLSFALGFGVFFFFLDVIIPVTYGLASQKMENVSLVDKQPNPEKYL